jgi:rhodanese-related sulfurtransferase
MNKRLLSLAVVVFTFLCFVSVTCSETVPKDQKKVTTEGKYVTVVEAYDMWKASPEKVKIIDCRTPEEYALIGHAPMAYNVPSKLWNGKFNAEKKEYGLDDNPDFDAAVKKVVKPGDTVMVMCRSGHRSAMSVNRLATAGIKGVYNIIDGFEGDKIAEEDSYMKGKRAKNGWRNAGLPWTYSLDPKLVYHPGK